MKIFFLVSSLHAGGAERVATTLCNAWAARGDAVTLVSTYSGTGTCFYPLEPGVKHVSLAAAAGSQGKSISSYLKRFGLLRRMLADRQPDVVISFLPHVNVAAILASGVGGPPVIVCERNDPSSRSPREFWEIASRLTYRFARVMTVQTEAVAARIHHYYPGLRDVRVVPNPLPNEVAAVLRKPPCNARKILLCMGRLDPQKNVDKTIDAFAALACRHSDWDLHIYGRGSQELQLKAQAARRGLAHRIHFRGVTSAPWNVMEHADAFVMTSRHEGFPNALLEAMGVGLPCVVTDCPSGPREITRAGADAMLVPLNDKEALGAALSTLMGDAGRREALGLRARASVLKRYGLAGVLEIWDDVLRSATLERAQHAHAGGPTA